MVWCVWCVQRKQWTNNLQNTSSYILIVIFLLNYISEVRSASPTGQPSRQPTRQPTSQVCLLSSSYHTLPSTGAIITRTTLLPTTLLISFVSFAKTELAQNPLPIIYYNYLYSLLCCRNLTYTNFHSVVTLNFSHLDNQLCDHHHNQVNNQPNSHRVSRVVSQVVYLHSNLVLNRVINLHNNLAW